MAKLFSVMINSLVLFSFASTHCKSTFLSDRATPENHCTKEKETKKQKTNTKLSEMLFLNNIKILNSS